MANPNRHWEQNKDCTLYIGNIAEETKDEIIYELMLQCGPIVSVHLPKDRVSQQHQGYGFVEFTTEEDATYACNIMNGIRLYGKPIRLNKASADKRTVTEGGVTTTAPTSVGAELFIGGLDTLVDERTLYDTFSRFGPLLAPPKITRDESGLSKGFGFVSYSTFEASDDAINNMNGQYLGGKEVKVQYAFKKDGKGEKHGDQAERALAAHAIKNSVQVAIPAMPAALVMPQQTVPVVPQVPNGYGMGAVQQPAMYNNAQPPRQYNQSPLQAPGANAGLPPRPPPAAGGYGGHPGLPAFPTNGQMPPPFPATGQMPPAFPPGQMPPLGFPVNGQMPPPVYPPGYAQQPYQQAPPGTYRP